jgi:hypothetical protein
VIVSTRLALAGAILVLAAAGCGPATQSPKPSAGASSATDRAPTPAPSDSPPVTPSLSPAPSLVPTASPAPSVAACADLPQTGILPSDRFVDLAATTGPDADRLTFVFGNASLPGPPSPPRGTLEVAAPPYTQAGSGAPIEVSGAHVVLVRFSGMSLSDDLGQPTYDGPTEVEPGFAALRHAILFDSSEGVVGWYVGYDGSGCVSLVRSGSKLTLVIEHG